MENSEINLQSNDSLLMNDEIREYLLETARWGKFLAILGFIGLVLMVIFIAFLLGFAGSGSESIIALVYILMTLLYYFPISYLYQFSVDITNGVNSNDQELFTSGLKNLKSLFKFQGIVTIVGISIYLLSFLVILMIAL